MSTPHTTILFNYANVSFVYIATTRRGGVPDSRGDYYCAETRAAEEGVVWPIRRQHQPRELIMLVTVSPVEKLYTPLEKRMLYFTFCIL